MSEMRDGLVLLYVTHGCNKARGPFKKGFDPGTKLDLPVYHVYIRRGSQSEDDSAISELNSEMNEIVIFMQDLLEDLDWPVVLYSKVTEPSKSLVFATIPLQLARHVF